MGREEILGSTRRREGQVSPFLIISIITLFLIGILLYMRSSYMSGAASSSADELFRMSSHIRAIRDYLSSCAEFTLGEGVRLIAAQGDYLDPAHTDGGAIPYVKLGGEPFKIPILLDKDVIDINGRLVPDSEISREICDYVKANMKGCLESGDYFRKMGINMRYPPPDRIECDADIKSGGIIMSLYYPLKIESEDEGFTARTIRKRVYSRMKFFNRETAERIYVLRGVLSQETTKEDIESQFALANFYPADILDSEDNPDIPKDVFIIKMVDFRKRINGFLVVYQFAVNKSYQSAIS